MAVYPTSITYEVYINGAWEDITHDVILSQECKYGIQGNSQVDRVASTGILKFTLRNDSSSLGGIEGYYSPNVSGAKSGWRIGIPVRLVILYDGQTFYKFYGHITKIDLMSGQYGIRRVNVEASDWMDYAATHPLILPEIAYDKRIEEVVDLILDNMPVQPLNKSFSVGENTFPTVFDTVRDNTKALSEFTKLALSEPGYIYIRRNRTDGETLVVESKYTRNTDSELTKVPISKANSGFLVLETGDYLLLEDGSRIYLDEITEIDFDNNMLSLETQYGSNLVNRVSVKAYPRKVDSAATTVLFSLNTAISLSAGETKTFRGTYRDPSGGANKVSGKDMVAPEATTDYLFNSKADGTGTNLTANLSVTAVYGSEGVEYTLTNNGSAGYVTKLQARGKGIYIYDPIQYISEDTTSINSYGYMPLTVEMKYQDNPYEAITVADTILQQDKDPRTVVDTINLFANYNELLMFAFLYLDIGDLIHVKENQTGIDNFYYIQAVEFSIQAGGVIKYSWTVKDALSLSTIYWTLDTVGKSELGTTTVIGY